jgi:hypothetical protein
VVVEDSIIFLGVGEGGRDNHFNINILVLFLAYNDHRKR